ncbi:MAG: flagellar basal-body MS-ring/collar protein FliF [Betaproteobacteria bacterium]|nr:flagellar basal-body MS-ring/collar protein FliF [Betaproteobacteria bacterium]
MATLPQTLQPVLGGLPGRLRLSGLIGIAAVIAVLGAAWMWASTPDYRVLFSNISDRDGGAIVAALDQMNVPYKFSEGGGAILVPAGQVHDARLKLASQGLPRGAAVGFELMESQKLGITQFQEQVNYQRALEGELARSIQSLAAVRAARVHLAIPKPSVFMREQQKPTASVLVSLHAGRTLERAQISGIVHLISSSVPQLSAREVSVLDDAGTLLSNPQASDSSLDPSQLAQVQLTEAAYIRRIVDILEPIVGRGNVRAQVAADIDFSFTESTAEIFKPNQGPGVSAVRSQQTSEAGGAAAAGAEGVPGSASNQPAAKAAGAAPAAAPVAAQPTRKESTVSYEVDRTVRHVRAPVGGLRRLSAAVVVNFRRVTDAAGKTSHEPLKAEEMSQINALVREAIGFSAQRGDSLNVANAAFSIAEPPAALPELPIWRQPENIALAKEFGKATLLGLLGLYLLFGVLRPFMRQLAASGGQPALLAAQNLPALPAPETGTGGAARAPDARLDSLRQIARQDPKAVANIVRNWVSKD